MILLIILIIILVLAKIGVCIIVELDNQWMLGCHFGKYGVGLALGFVSITAYRVTFSMVRRAIGEGAINEYMVKTDDPNH